MTPQARRGGLRPGSQTPYSCPTVISWLLVPQVETFGSMTAPQTNILRSFNSLVRNCAARYKCKVLFVLELIGIPVHVLLSYNNINVD